VEAIRIALIQAGVPANRIKIGAFGDVASRHDRRIGMLLATAN
jgi:hypothetical protein